MFTVFRTLRTLKALKADKLVEEPVLTALIMIVMYLDVLIEMLVLLRL
jgi:hypothetical protein